MGIEPHMVGQGYSIQSHSSYRDRALVYTVQFPQRSLCHTILLARPYWHSAFFREGPLVAQFGKLLVKLGVTFLIPTLRE